MAWQDERPGAKLRLRLQPAITLSGRDRERLVLPVSGRRRELFASGVGCPPRPQDLESADSTKAATYAAFAALPPSGFPRRQPRRSSEDAVITFVLPCSRSIAPSLTKYASTALLIAPFTI